MGNGGRFQSSVVVIVCVSGCPLSVVAGWGGRSSSPVGFPGSLAVVVQSHGGFPFVPGGDACRLWVIGTVVDQSRWWWSCCQGFRMPIVVHGS